MLRSAARLSRASGMQRRRELVRKRFPVASGVLVRAGAHEEAPAALTAAARAQDALTLAVPFGTGLGLVRDGYEEQRKRLFPHYPN